MTIVTATPHVVYDCDHDNMRHNDRDRDDNFTPRDNSDRDTARGMATATTQSDDSARHHAWRDDSTCDTTHGTTTEHLRHHACRDDNACGTTRSAMTAPVAPRTARRQRPWHHVRREDRHDNSDRDTARGMATTTTT
jgi:hypothetical protein